VEHLKGVSLKHQIRLEGLPGTNTLAYNKYPLIYGRKKF
jgi:hypothetical protein